MICEAEPHDEKKPQVKEKIMCTDCGEEKAPEEYNQEKLLLWKKHDNVTRSAICITCEAKPPKTIKCTGCGEVKAREEYDEIMLQRWKKHRELKKKGRMQSMRCRTRIHHTGTEEKMETIQLHMQQVQYSEASKPL